VDHCSKQIDSLRSKEFYQQTNETQLLDKLNQSVQSQRNMKQHFQSQLQTLEDKFHDIGMEHLTAQHRELAKAQAQLKQQVSEKLEEANRKLWVLE